MIKSMCFLRHHLLNIKSNHKTSCFLESHSRHLLFGRNCLLEVPQFEGVVFRDCDQHRFHRMEGQGPHSIKVASQGIFGIPCLPELVLIGWQLKIEGGGGAVVEAF